MATFQVELKRVVDDSYPIEIGFDLMDHLVEDMKNGLLGGKQKLAVITDSEVEVLNPDLYICTLEEGATFSCDLYVARGCGYYSIEKNKERNKELKLNYPIGYIPIDSIFGPVKKASYNVESARVGQDITRDKLTLEVETNGAFSGREIVSLAAKIIEDHIRMFVDLSENFSRDILIPRESDNHRKVL